MLKNDVIGDEICGKLHPAEKSMLMTASGSVLTLANTLEKPFESLRLFGKSEQFKTNGLQLFDARGVEKNNTLMEDGTIAPNGNVHVSDFIKVIPNTTYSIYNVKQNRGKFYNADKQPITTDRFDFEPTNSPQFTIPEDVEYIRFSISNAVDLNTVMLNKSNTVKHWEPYTGGIPAPNIEYPQDIVNVGEDGSVTVSVNGKNLLPFVVGEKGKNFEVFEDGVFIDGPQNTDFYAVGSHDNVIESSYEEVPELTPGDYRMLSSSEDVTLFCVAWRNNKTIVIGRSVTSPAKISVQKGDKFRIFFRIRGEKFTGKVKAMITREPVTLEDYEPYRSQKLILSTPNGLPGILVTKDGNYTDEKGQQWACDEIDCDRRKYIQRLAYEIVDKSTLNIVALSENTFRFAVCKTKNSYKMSDAMSNFAPFFIWVNSKRSFAINGNQLYYGHTEVTTAEKIKQKFEALQKIEILGQLAEPIEHDLTAEEIEQYKALHTYAGTTVLTNDAELWMEAKYKAKPVGMRNRMVK